MKLKLSSAALSSQLSTLSKVLAPKNSLQILGCYLFEVKGQQLTITASDGENVVCATMQPDEVDVDGSFAVDAQTMADSMRELAEQPVVISVDLEAQRIEVDYLNGHYDFPLMPADEYPLLDRDEENELRRLSLPAAVLSDNISRSVFAIASEELRPIMNGICFDLTPESLAIVASDGHKLVRNRIFTIQSDEPIAFVLPKKPALFLKNILPHDDTPVTIDFTKRMAEIAFGNIFMQSRLAEGRYPNYNAVIPQDNPNQLNVDRKALLGVMRRVTPFSQRSKQVRLQLEPGKTSFRAEDMDFVIRAREELACDYLGTPMSIGFKGTTIIDILNNLESDDVHIELGDASRPALIMPEVQPQDTEVVMLVMPMLLND